MSQPLSHPPHSFCVLHRRSLEQRQHRCPHPPPPSHPSSSAPTNSSARVGKPNSAQNYNTADTIPSYGTSDSLCLSGASLSYFAGQRSPGNKASPGLVPETLVGARRILDRPGQPLVRPPLVLGPDVWPPPVAVGRVTLVAGGVSVRGRMPNAAAKMPAATKRIRVTTTMLFRREGSHPKSNAE